MTRGRADPRRRLRPVHRRERAHPAVPDRPVGRGRRDLDAAGWRSASSASRPRMAVLRELAEESGYQGEVIGLADVKDRVVTDSEGRRPDACDPHRLSRAGDRRRAARRDRRLDRHVRLVHARRGVPAQPRRLAKHALSLAAAETGVAMPASTDASSADPAPELTDAQHDHHRRRRPARTGLHARPGRRALGAAAAPLRPVAGARAPRGRLARSSTSWPAGR